jgi:hypothetical protein
MHWSYDSTVRIWNSATCNPEEAKCTQDCTADDYDYEDDDDDDDDDDDMQSRFVLNTTIFIHLTK